MAEGSLRGFYCKGVDVFPTLTVSDILMEARLKSKELEYRLSECRAAVASVAEAYHTDEKVNQALTMLDDLEQDALALKAKIQYTLQFCKH